MGFPLGAALLEVKAYEAQAAISHGAQEIDTVIHIGGLKARDLQRVGEDIAAVVRVSHAEGTLVKVIVEICLLNDEEKVNACRLAKEAGADYMKTSTVLSSDWATVEDVALMRRKVEAEMGVKASGGIHSLGTSAGVQIVQAQLADMPGRAEPGSRT